MKIYEIMILEHEEKLFTKFAQGIPVKMLEEYDFPVYRLEIDPSLVLIFYVFELQYIPPIHFLENIFPSLKRIIWLSREQQFMNLLPPDEYKKFFEQFEDIIPSAVVLAVADDNLPEMSEALLHQGCYLGDQSRLYLWNEKDPQNSRRIWQLIWSVHEVPIEAA
ncbi:MAG: hypothetical protein GQ561_08160 [Calditrichae bacterium]|nr:hypothetical protein [Calditrichia bacterium]